MALKRLAVPAAAAAAVFLWWSATSRKPAPDARTLLLARPEERAPEPAPEPPAPAPAAQAAPSELPPPEPVLAQSAQRRFSAPAAQAAAGGIAGAEPAEAAGGRPGFDPNLPGGYGAPTASVGRFDPPASAAGAPAAGGTRAAPAPREAPVPAPAGAKEDKGIEAPSPGDKAVAGAAAGLVNKARDLKSRGDAAAMKANASLEAGLMRQIEVDDRVDAGIRKAISRLQSSGRPVTMEAVTEAAEDVLEENGLAPDDVDLPTAIARASAPPPPEVPRAAYLDAVKAIVASPPLDDAAKVEIQKLAEKPPPPRAPPPRGAIEAFRQHKDVFDKALKDFGVKPEHILGILGVETGWGRNTGKYPLPSTLKAISERTGPDGRPTKQAKQAARDLAALARLSAQGNLGGLEPGQVRGSYAGAMGIPQFLPSSWEALSRSPDGGKRDPFDFRDAAYSVGNYLRASGYNRDVARSIWGYNHSQEYVDKVLGLSAKVKSGLPAEAPPAR